MKTVYTVQHQAIIYQVSSNLLVAYQCLQAHSADIDHNYFKSYVTVYRAFKKQSYYSVPSVIGTKWEIRKFNLKSKFKQPDATI